MKKMGIGTEFRQFGLVIATTLILMLASSYAFAFDLEVKGTDVQIGGYIKAMFIYDIDNLNDNTNSPYQGDIFNPYAVVLNGDASGKDKMDDLRFTARESRLFVKTKSDYEGSVFRTHFEGDFYGNSDVGAGGGYETWSSSYGFRLRHAYGTISRGNYSVLAGQTWSTFMDLPGTTPSMDFNGDLGTSFVRQTMFRYTYNFAKGNNLSIALENPDRGLTQGTYLFINPGTPETKWPDFIAKYWYGSSWGHISPKIVVRRFNLSGEEATAVGGSLTGHINISKHKLFFGTLFGDGLGRYGGLGNYAGAGLTADGKIELVPFFAAYLGTQIQITDAWAFIAGVGYSNEDKSDTYEGANAILTGNATETAHSVRTFLKYTPNRYWEWAGGVVYGDRKVMDGRKGDGKRVQTYLKFNF